MKAFVLAAGAGTRLRPLTSNIPKPMVPVLGHPALFYTLNNLKNYGFNDICVNLYHCPDIITDYFNKKDMGISLRYSPEKKLMGTAGAIKKNESFFDDTFVVMSGDGLTDIDLGKALAFHKKNRSLATVVLKKIESRLEYGVTVTDKKGKIKTFIEKPYWGDIFTNTVNTGIYIFEPGIFKFIPENKFFDFSMDLFPLLLRNKENIYGYVMNEYWTDIGNINEYKKGVFDILDGKVKIPGFKNKKNNISKTAKIGRGVKICGPCYIGSDAVIGENCIINPYSVISEKVKIGDNSNIGKSIIWGNARTGKGACLDNTIVGYRSRVPSNTAFFDSIIGSYF